MSNNTTFGFTPDGLRMIAQNRPAKDALTELDKQYREHFVEKRLGAKKIKLAIQRYESGESARSIAADYGVAASALLRVFRENCVRVRGPKVTTAETKAEIVRGYEAGATVAELEDTHHVSHGTVLRTLHKAGVTMRAKAPRRHI
ncbi:hypothetical protein [Leucobacter aridicollis]|uniref:hypothetical protein n=1 Tax=Leucobacter aridicollis TaxID=283878 RepID=UPI00216A8ED5|nr:hypothetical protein [Leucobacter aridicollis]MCS3427121.1 transposase-like protein [Leucobacter aridicollis]